MNGSLKKSSRTLYGVCACIIVLMVICYFGVSNTKGTYSADDNYTYSCGSGWTLSSDKQKCCFGVWAAEGICCASGYPYYVNGKCNTKSDGTGSSIGQATIADSTKTLVSSSGACYVANHRYVWLLTDPNNSSYTKVDKSSAECSGCVSGYVDDGEGYCVSMTSCSDVINVSCGQSTMTSTNPNYTSCTVNGTTYYYSKSTGGTCLDTTEGYPYTYYNYKKISAISCESEERGSCGDDEIISTNSNMTSCTKDGVTYNYDGEEIGTCEYTEDEGQKFKYYKYTKTGSNEVSCTRKYVNCDKTTQEKDCTTLGGTLSGGTNTCNRYSSGCASDTFTCDNDSSSTDDGGNTGGGTTGGGGTSTPSSSSSSSNSSSSSTTSVSSSSNVDDNPGTGSVAIFMVWVIALGTLIYSFVYFKQSKFE